MPVLYSPLRVLQNLAAGLASFAWTLPFLVMDGCNQSSEEAGWDLLKAAPVFWLPALVLPALWFLLGGRSAAADALRFPVCGLGLVLGAFLPLLAPLTGGELRIGGVLSVGAWVLLYGFGLADALTRWWETRQRPPRGGWTAVLARGPHVLALAGLAVQPSEEVLHLVLLWFFFLAPLSLGVVVLGRAWPRWGPVALVAVAMCLTGIAGTVVFGGGTQWRFVGVLAAWAAGEAAWHEILAARGRSGVS